MLPLMLRPPSEGGYDVLCLGAHSDDLEIGCGGTMIRLLQELPVERITWVVLSGNAERAAEARRGARRVLGRHPGARVLQADFRDGFFPYTAAPIKEYFEMLKAEASPDLVFTHYRHDRHQDHRLVSDLTYNTFRDHLILEYEIMKVDGDLGNPSVYVPLDAADGQAEGASCWTTASARSVTSAGSTRSRSAASCACEGWRRAHRAATPRPSTHGRSSSEHDGHDRT